MKKGGINICFDIHFDFHNCLGFRYSNFGFGLRA